MRSHTLRAAAGNAGGGGPLELTYDQFAVGEGGLAQVPATADAGDLAVYLDVVNGSFSYTYPPDGWTDFVYFYVSNFRKALFSYKILESGDIGNYIFGMDKAQAAMLIFKPSVPITSVSGGGGVGQFTSGNPSAITIASGSQTAPVISLAAASGYDGPTFSTNTMTALTATDSLTALYSIYNTSPSNDTVDMDDNGSSNIIAGGYLTVS